MSPKKDKGEKKKLGKRETITLIGEQSSKEVKCMKNIDHLSDEELHKLLSKHLSKEAAKQLLEIDRSDRGLLVQNLSCLDKSLCSRRKSKSKSKNR